MKRCEIDDKYKWNLNDIISNEDEWNKIYEETEEDIKKLNSFSGKLNNKNVILACLDFNSVISERIERLYVYVKMKMGEDTSLSKYQALTDKAERILVPYSAESSFITPEITKLSDDMLKEFVLDEDLQNHSCYSESVIREKKHILSENEEKLLSNMQAFTDNFHQTFNLFDNVDVDFGEVPFEGKKVKLTHGTYSMILQGTDRKAIKTTYQHMFGAYKKMINVLASNYAGNVKKKTAFLQKCDKQSHVQ